MNGWVGARTLAPARGHIVSVDHSPVITVTIHTDDGRTIYSGPDLLELADPEHPVIRCPWCDDWRLTTHPCTTCRHTGRNHPQ